MRCFALTCWASKCWVATVLTSWSLRVFPSSCITLFISAACLWMSRVDHWIRMDPCPEPLSWTPPNQCDELTSPGVSSAPCLSRWLTPTHWRNNCVLGWAAFLRPESESAGGKHLQSPRPSWAPQVERVRVSSKDRHYLLQSKMYSGGVMLLQLICLWPVHLFSNDLGGNKTEENRNKCIHLMHDFDVS